MTELWAETALLHGGWAGDVLVKIGDEGRIAMVAPGTPRPAGGVHTVDVLLPAPANVHSHAFQRAMAGLTESRGGAPHDSFWTWRAVMYRFLDHLAPDDVELIAALAQMEMLEAGYAAVAEFHYLHNQPGGTPYADAAELARRIAAAAGITGIGLTLLPVYYATGDIDGRPLEGGQRRFRTDRDHFARIMEGAEQAIAALPSDAGIGVAPHSLRAVPPADLVWLAELRPEAPLHIHVAEQTDEVAAVEAAYGRRPVAWLLDHHPVDERWCLIHATHMTDAEVDALARSGATVGLCPVTEANLGDGVFAARRFIERDGAFGIGTDSNIRISLSEELRGLEYAQRLDHRQRAVLASPEQSTGRRLYGMACRGGAQALARDSDGLAVNNLADLLALDGRSIHLSGLAGDCLLDAFLFAGDDRLITDVWSAGRHVVRDGRHVARDVVLKRCRPVLDRLRRVF